MPKCATSGRCRALIGYYRNSNKPAFDRLNVLDVTHTSVIEQRQTPWMAFQSLADFLDPSDPNKTIEGYPAPFAGHYLGTSTAFSTKTLSKIHQFGKARRGMGPDHQLLQNTLALLLAFRGC